MKQLLLIALAFASEGGHAGMPAPRGTRTFAVAQRGYAVEAYDVEGAPTEALASYARTLTGAHLRVHRIQGALAVRGRETAIVHAYRDGERTVLALVRLGDPDARPWSGGGIGPGGSP
jgi:hypothetical protein